MTSVTVRDVTKHFDDARAPVLVGVDLDVPDGSTLSLLGPSGSGKSTLLRIVAGLERADAGTVALGDDVVSDVPAHRRDVGVVFQDQALFPHLDVAGNVGFGLKMAGVARSARPAAVSEALHLVGLGGYETRDTATLSGGEAQRVALARALAPRPGVLLLDEPFAALDQLLRERLLLELRSLFDELAVTVIAVTHDPTEAAALGDRVAVLLDGRIAQVGPAGEVLSTPASVAVAGLVGQRNVAPATWADGWVDCPWGLFQIVPPWSTPEGAVAVLVPPDAITSTADGPLHGVVKGLLFRGGSGFAVVAGADGTWPSLDVRADPRWSIGDAVRLDVDAERVQILPAGAD